MRLLGIESTVWIPAVSGAVGALFGAMASVGGQLVAVRSQQRQRLEERQAAGEEKREGTFNQAGNALGQAFSLLHEVDSLSKDTVPPGAADLDEVKRRLLEISKGLVVIGIGLPDKDTAEKSMSLVGELNNAYRSLATPSESVGRPTSLVADAMNLLFDVVNSIRESRGLPLVFGENQSGR